MTKIDLPDGVPFDNEGKSSLSDSALPVPDMATPQFERQAQGRDHKANHAVRGDFSTLVEDDDLNDGSDVHPRGRSGPGNNVIIVIAITTLLAVLGAFFVATSRGDTPLCSSQPIWNQYNCRAG